MIDTPLPTIIDRLTHTLEHTIAPEIASPVVRGQLFSVVELLNQLLGKIEYRHDLVLADIDRGQQTLALLIPVLTEARVDIPEEIAAAGQPADRSRVVGDDLLAARRRTEAAVSAALDLLDRHRAAIPEADQLEARVLGMLQQGVMRDLMLFRPQRFDKISQRAEED